MIEDKREDVRMRQLIDAHTHEVESVIRNFNEQLGGKLGREAVELHLQRHAVLVELLTQQKRVLDYLLGNPVDPQPHFGEAVLLPAGGFGE